ncbi:hypothetical protein D3C75_744390 [compost metagenome]
MILDSPKLTGNPVEGAVAKGNISGTASIDLALGSYFTATVTAATVITLSSTGANGGIRGALIKLTNPGVGALTFSPALKWAGGTAPTFTAAGVDFINILSDDGITFYGSIALKDAK